MPIYAGSSRAVRAYSGSTPVRRIYLNNSIVYQLFAPLGMNKSGTQAGTGTTPTALTGWTADAGTTISNNEIVVPPGISAVAVTATVTIAWSGGNRPKVQAILRHNGNSVAQSAYGATNPAVVSAPLTINAGDTLGVYWVGEGSLFNRPTAQAAGTSLKVVAR